MFKNLAMLLPAWITLAPSSPHHNQLLSDTLDRTESLEKFPDALSAILTGSAHGLCLLEVFVSNASVDATNLVLGGAPVFAYEMKGDQPNRILFLATPIDVKTFELQNQQGQLFFKFYNGTPFFLGQTEWQFESNLNRDALAPLPSYLLKGLESALIQQGIALDPVVYPEQRTPFSPEAQEIQDRLLAEKLTNPVISGALPLQGAVDQLASPKFLYELIFDRLDRHGVRLPLEWDKGLLAETPFTKKHQTWSYQELYNYTHSAIRSNLEDTTRMTLAVRECLEHMSTAQIDTIQEALLLKFIATQSGLDLSVTHLRRQLTTLRQSDRFQTHSDVANDLFERMSLVTSYRYHDTKFWQWGGSHWVTLPDASILARISEDYGHLPSARRASDHHGIKSVLAGKMSEALKTATEDGVNLRNGFLDTQLTLHKHHPNFGQTHTLPCAYEPENTKMPLFWKFLQDTWGCDDDYQAKVDALQEMIAVTLFGMSRLYQRAFLLYGVPKSGKTQLLNLISYLVPTEGKCSVGPEDWHDRFRPAQMANKILNVVGELSERKAIDGQKFKDIIDGTEQMSEFKGRDHFTFVPRCAHWFASNHLPKTRDTSDGFNRRWLILTFNHPVPKGDTLVRDLGLKIAQEEREAIVAWAAQAITRVTEASDYTLPPSHFETTALMASQNNSLAFFMFGSGKIQLRDRSLVERRLTVDEKLEWLKSKDYLLGDTLYHTYSQWCSETAGVRPVSSAKFHTQMREMAATHGFIQNRIRYANGIEGYAYWNLMLLSHHPSPLMGELSDPTVKTERYGDQWTKES